MKTVTATDLTLCLRKIGNILCEFCRQWLTECMIQWTTAKFLATTPAFQNTTNQSINQWSTVFCAPNSRPESCT